MSNKAVFLDRDGVINDGTLYYTYKQEDFFFNEGIVEALTLVQNQGYKLIVVTNQGGVAKGEYTCADVELLHDYMTELFHSFGIFITDVFYCPHHSDVSDCNCRKPKPGMILDAIKKHNLNPDQCYLIGDSQRDCEAGEAAGIKSFKIDKNQNIFPLCEQIALLI